MTRQSWLCTVVTQLSLCFALFLALNIGRPQKPVFHGQSETRSPPTDLYFISVRGGFWPPKEQTHLLKLIGQVTKAYKLRFVINISELGEEDPLTLNATLYFRSLKVPWYTTKASKGLQTGYFHKKVELSHGTSFDLFVVDTSSLQDPSMGMASHQLQWLTATLEASDSNWCMIAGFHSIVVCEERIEQMGIKQAFETLHGISLKYGVNAYLSGQACTNPLQQDKMEIANVGALYLTDVNQRVGFNNEMIPGFLLHRVSPLEIVTYSISLAGDVVQKIALQQPGKAVM